MSGGAAGAATPGGMEGQFEFQTSLVSAAAAGATAASGGMVNLISTKKENIGWLTIVPSNRDGGVVLNLRLAENHFCSIWAGAGLGWIGLDWIELN